MKDIKCPLCGTLLQFFYELKFGELGRVGCSSCEWVTFLASSHRAWKAAEEFVSKFPPFLRVHQGDNLKLDFDDDILTVIGKDTDRCKIYLEDCKGNTEIATPDDVDQWPWELDQKGGQQ